jgi:hypothetical protein
MMNWRANFSRKNIGVDAAGNFLGVPWGEFSQAESVMDGIRVGGPRLDTEKV